MSEDAATGVCNRFWFGQVDYPEKGKVISTVSYLDEHYEIETSISARAFDYKVGTASFRVIRAPGGKSESYSGSFPGLKGAIAYAGIGETVERAVGEDKTGLIKSLMLENVKVLRQARLFVWEREGIDPSSQIVLIEKLLKDSCIHFAQPGSLKSVLEPVQLEMMVRGECLFTRHRYSMMRRAKGFEHVTSGLSDSYHEMQAELRVEGDKVLCLQGRMLRAPHPICYDAQRLDLPVENLKVSTGPNSFGKAFMGLKGCAHLGDVARETCASLQYWRKMRAAAKPSGSTSKDDSLSLVAYDNGEMTNVA